MTSHNPLEQWETLCNLGTLVPPQGSDVAAVRCASSELASSKSINEHRGSSYIFELVSKLAIKHNRPFIARLILASNSRLFWSMLGCGDTKYSLNKPGVRRLEGGPDL